MEKYRGEDRREKTQNFPFDFFKFWPVIIILASSIGGYYVLLYRVAALEYNLRELKSDTKESFAQLNELINKNNYGLRTVPKDKK